MTEYVHVVSINFTTDINIKLIYTCTVFITVFFQSTEILMECAFTETYLIYYSFS